MEADAIECDVLPPGSLERAAAMERVKLAFISGQGSLVALSVRERVPYQYVLRASSDEKWSEQKLAVAQKTDSKLSENLADFIAEQRTLQVKRALTRAQKLQDLADLAANNEKAKPDGLLASAVQALASAEERADNIVRRNLGMDQQSNGGGSVSINILAGGISLS